MRDRIEKLPALALAPMLGISDFPTRLWIALAGAPAAMTAPYLRATGAIWDVADLERALPELTVLKGILPYQLTPQMLGTDPVNIARMAGILGKLSAVVEINCGCPTPSAAGPWAGSGILREPDRLRKHLDALLLEVGPGRCAVKCRIGYESDSEWTQIFEAIADLPLARLTIHGRTRAEGYHGRSRTDIIGRCAAEAKYPVWLSGDVTDADSFSRARQLAPAIAGIMIGRGALSNPFIFSQITGSVGPVDPEIHQAALVTYALLHEIWQKKPVRLVSRLNSGRLQIDCSNDPGRWRRMIHGLLSILGAPPAEPDLADLGTIVGGVTRRRLRTVTSYMAAAVQS